MIIYVLYPCKRSEGIFGAIFGGTEAEIESAETLGFRKKNDQPDKVDFN